MATVRCWLLVCVTVCLGAPVTGGQGLQQRRTMEYDINRGVRRIDTPITTLSAGSHADCLVSCRNHDTCYFANVRTTADGQLQCELMKNSATGNDVSDSSSTLYVAEWLCMDTACYHFSRDNCTMAACRQRCEAKNRDAHLLLLESQQENDDLYSLMSLYGLLGYYWLDIQETTGSVAGTWVDRSGDPLAFVNFAAGEPSQASEQCAFIYDLTSKMEWADVACDLSTIIKYICKYKK